ITTVSRQYAQEVQTPAFGCGFEGILQRRSADLVGILNGIDVREWDPARDDFLPAAFEASDLTGKAEDKRALLEHYGLTATDETMSGPLVAMISRMVDQKGLDLIEAIAADLPALDASWVVLGTGEPRYQDMWTGLAQRHPDRIGARIGFDEPLAHL